jgi:hypothetical protein
MTPDGMRPTTTTFDERYADPVRIVACPQCGLAAEIVDQAVVSSTAGPVDIIHLVCVQRHWFLMPLDRLTTPPAPVHGSRPATM